MWLKPFSLYLFLSSRLKATVIAVYFRGCVKNKELTLNPSLKKRGTFKKL